MAAHHGGEVVHLEERGQPFGVLLAGLQALDDGELTLDQSEDAQRQADVGTLGRVLRPVQLLLRGLQLGAQLLARVGHPLPLTDQVLAVGLQCANPLLEGQRVAVQGVDGAHDLGELVLAAGEPDGLLVLRLVRETRRAEAQHGQRPGQRAGQAGGDADREQQQRDQRGDADLQLGDVVGAQLLQGLHPALVERGLGAAHQVEAGGQRGGELLRVGGQFLVVQHRPVGEVPQVLARGLGLAAGDGGVEGVRRLLGGVGAELCQRGVGTDPGLLGGRGQRVTPGGVGRGGHPGGRGGAGDRVVDGGGGARHRQRGQQQAAGGRRLLDGGVQVGQRVRARPGPRRHAVGQLAGQAVQFRDGLGVRLVRFESGALAGERRSAGARDLVEVGPERGREVRVLAQILYLPVHPGAALLGGRPRLGAPGRDVRGDLVPFVGEGVGEGQGVLGLLGERDQVLALVQPPRGGEEGGGAGSRDGGGHHGHRDDEPVAYMRGPAPAHLATGRGGRARGAGGGGRVLRALAGGLLLARTPRPRLLHRCSHS